MTVMCDTSLAQGFLLPEKTHLFINTLKLGSGAMAAIAGTSSKHRESPHIIDEEFDQDQSAVIKNLLARIEELEDTLSIMKDAEVKASTDDHGKLKPIDIKDIVRPDKYDNQAAKFNNGFDKLKGMLTSRNGNWEKLLGLIENRGKVTIKSQKEIINSVDDATYKSIKEQSDTYSQHVPENQHRWRAPCARDPDRL